MASIPKNILWYAGNIPSNVAKWLRTGDLGRREVDVRVPRQRKGPSKVILCSVEGPIVVPFYLAFAGKRGDMLWIWSVYLFGDKFKVIAKLSEKVF